MAAVVFRSANRGSGLSGSQEEVVNVMIISDWLDAVRRAQKGLRRTKDLFHNYLFGAIGPNKSNVSSTRCVTISLLDLRRDKLLNVRVTFVLRSFVRFNSRKQRST